VISNHAKKRPAGRRKLTGPDARAWLEAVAQLVSIAVTIYAAVRR
jgi:hypothetical protein